LVDLWSVVPVVEEVPVKTLFKILFVIAFSFIAVHSIRLIYGVWLEPTGSVLDKYDDKTEAQVKEAESLEELEALYVEARREVEDLEASSEDLEDLEPYQRQQREPYKSEAFLEGSIRRWEQQSRALFELRVYWAIGFVLMLLGLLAFRSVNPWLGLALLVVAFSEMIYWSSPPYFSPGLAEYERLINNKLTFALITWALTAGVGFFSGALSENREK